jgi:prepilin-type N-terminal cleavage/methylation domain-containing protein
MAVLIHYLISHTMDNMDFRTLSIRHVNHDSRRAFTLVEVMVGAAISSFLLAGVLSTFLFMGRTSANIVNYSTLEETARKALERFSSEVHLAYAVGTSYSSTSVTLSIPDNTPDRIPANPTANGAYSVTYAFDAANKLLTRSVNGGTAEPFITGIEQVSGVPFFNYYKYVNAGTVPIPGQGYDDAASTNYAGSLKEIRQIEVSFSIRRQNVTVASATNKVLSARFILRNK